MKVSIRSRIPLWAFPVGAVVLATSLVAVPLRFTIEGKSNNRLLGSSVVALNDLNGDKIPDLAVGDPGFTAEGPGRTRLGGSGQVLVISGKDGSILRRLRGSPGRDQAFGVSLAAIHANADRKLDIAVGATGGSGAVWIYSGANGSLIRQITSPSPGIGSGFGFAIAGAGDQDRDGRTDLFVGAPGARSGNGRVALISGADGSRLREYFPNTRNSGFGSSIVALPDRNGDDRLELAVGSAGFAGGLGRVQILASSNGNPQAVHAGRIPGARLGARIGRVRDLNNDETPELVVGSASGGSAYLLDGISLRVLEDLSRADAAQDLPVVPGGSIDIDRDGDFEMLIGYPGSSPRGRVWVIPAPRATERDNYRAAKRDSAFGFAIDVIPGLGFAIGEPLASGGGAVHVYSTLADSDGDKVPDIHDGRRYSILTHYVRFGSVSSGVENRVDDDGCSLADLFARLEPATGWASHEQFISRAVPLIDRLRKERRISGKEAHRLGSAAGRSKIGEGQIRDAK